MIAVLRYMVLKTWRDNSLVGLLLLPALAPASALLGVTLRSGRFRYPLFISPEQTPVQNATLAEIIAMIVCVLVATMAAFWTLRPELAGRSIASFLFGVRPIEIVGALIAFGSAIGIGSATVTTTEVWLLTTSVPEHLGTFLLTAITAVIGASAVGAMIVMISPNPVMVVCAYVGCVVLAALMKGVTSANQLLAVGALAAICTVAAAFFLERRCGA